MESKLYDYPHTFDRTLNYVVDRFGKYVPYIVSDPVLLRVCLQRCDVDFGFVPEFDVVTQGLHEFDDLCDPDPDLPFTSAGPDDQFVIDEF